MNAAMVGSRGEDFPVQETLEFVRLHLGSGSARILEIGCGDGALALRLQKLGHDVVALDSSQESVFKAQSQGVNAHWATWPDFHCEDGLFDAILFTRSLHHIESLDAAIVQAKACLSFQGKLLVEDFAFDEATALATQWLYQMMAVLHENQIIDIRKDEFARQLLDQQGAFDVWRESHHHDLHSAQSMLACVSEHFSDTQVIDVPYLYRYVVEIFHDEETALGLAKRLWELEQQFFKFHDIRLIGRRYAASLNHKGA